ncbi:MAG: hypothetical protein CVV56_05480 [Tenericutes bacterium HGW-Tenericutes-1]|jgi:Fe-S cluster assembly protein SufD|nr:MAG: hypothetical protein CVV56_05480 [Tenericutes bacterium HGW-Tenericutes-1]
MRIPKLLNSQTDTFIIKGQSVIQTHSSIKVLTKDHQVRIIINKKNNNTQPVDIVLTDPLLNHQYSLEFGRNSNWRVNFFYIVGKTLNSELNIILKEEAQIDLNLLMVGKIKESSTITRHTTLNTQSVLSVTTGYLTDGLLKVNDSVLLKGAYSDFFGENLVIGQSTDEVTITQNVRHSAKNSSSLIHNSIVANDACRIKFDIYGTIDKTMEKSKCFQHSKGVILGEKSWIQVDPKLIINEYDVEAGHGAAIGQINQDELYYLSSRGLTESHAKRLIIQGYTDPFVTKFLKMDHQHFVNQTIVRKMGGH